MSEKVDIWALGVILFKLAFFQTPFEDNRGNVDANEILKGLGERKVSVFLLHRWREKEQGRGGGGVRCYQASLCCACISDVVVVLCWRDLCFVIICLSNVFYVCCLLADTFSIILILIAKLRAVDDCSVC